jgi:hypothetical protein
MLRMTPRQLAIAGCVVLLIAVIATVADAHAGDQHRRPLLQRISQPRLERAAERAVAAGRIHSSRWGDATPWLRNISRELVRRAFAGDAERWALCVVDRESGFNPGAVSSTGDHGLPQIHRTAHRWVDTRRIVVDPVYGVSVFVALSDHGRNRGPWAGGSDVC